MPTRRVQINTSIHDFSPLLRNHEFLFKRIKATGVNGIELVIGFKSRWSVEYYNTLSKTYDIPIISLHQPAWSALGIYFDEGFFNLAQELNVKHVTCHPLPKTSFQSKRMRNYLKKLSQIQQQRGVEILIENLPEVYNQKLVNYFFPPDVDSGDILSLYEAVSEYDLKMTLDIDHLRTAAPHKEKWFKKVLPKIGNIHLSSFDTKRKHLPLYLGSFRSKEFINYLRKEKYNGLLTFEIDYPGLFTFFDYDFDAIKKSVEMIKKS